MKTIILLMTLLSTSVFSGEAKKTPEKATVTWTFILFEGAQTKLIASGKIPMSKYEESFKRDYPVGGERIEVPKDAISIGCLILTRVDEVLVMPICKWQVGDTNMFACQSEEIGKAPVFSVLKMSLQDLSNSIKKQLQVTKMQNKAQQTDS